MVLVEALGECCLGEALGYQIQAAFASCPCSLIGKGQLGAPESRPQAIPRACLDLTTWSLHLLGTMGIPGAWSVPLVFPASALGQSLLQAHNIHATAAQCSLSDVLVPFSSLNQAEASPSSTNRPTNNGYPSRVGRGLLP